MKILLLGGNGYIGSKFYQTYCDKHEICSVDLCLFGHDLQYSTQTNYRLLDQLLINSFDAIICLAGHSSVQMCEFDHSRSWLNNVEYFRWLCGVLSPHQKLIYASSASVYGATQGISTEDTPISFDSINHYDLQKITVDLLANRYIRHNKNIVGFRFGTVNGPSPNTRQELMLNSMVKSAIESRTVHIKNTHIRRAILGIDDLVRSLDAALDCDLTPGQYNLASINSTVRDLADTVAQMTGADIVHHPNDATAYDFQISTEKFQHYSQYKFTDSIQSIVNALINQYSTVSFDVRDNDRHFAQFI